MPGEIRRNASRRPDASTTSPRVRSADEAHLPAHGEHAAVAGHRRSGERRNSVRAGMPSTTRAMMTGLPSWTHATEHGRAYSTPLTASAARTMTRSPERHGLHARHEQRAAHT